MVKGPTLLLVMFLVLSCRAAGWSDGRCSGRSAGSGEQRFPSGFPGPTLGQVQDDLPGRGREACRDLDEFAADGAAARFAEIGAGERADGAGQVERDRCQDQPVCVRGENTRRQVAQCAVCQVGVDLLDNRVLAMRLVGGDRVQLAVVKNAWKRCE